MRRRVTTPENNISLDSFVLQELPVKVPELRRKNIVRRKGIVQPSPNIMPEHTLMTLEGIDKPFCFTGKQVLTLPSVGAVVEIIATEGAVWHFVKWWGEVKLSGYKVRSNDDIEQIALEILAGSPDERITADDLHTAEVYQIMQDKKRDPRVLGSVLGSLGKRGILKSAGFMRSRRKECHNRPSLVLWTWNTD